MKNSRIALKPYLDKIKGYCNSLSKAELTEVIIQLAKGISTVDRVKFLEKIESCLPSVELKTTYATDSVEEIQREIEALKESIEERIESIEDGSYWDHADTWEDNGYDDEDPDYISEDQSDELVSFFNEAGDLFLQDSLEDARKVYKSLFELIGTIEKMADVFKWDEIDIREERARYCRCVYETSKKEDWTDAFVNAMEIDVPNRYNLYDYDEEYPLLQDVIDARPHVIADLNLFLTAWKKALTQKGLNTRPAVLLLETSHRLEGLDGVSKLARKWKNKQPQGYLFWLDILKRENDPKSIIKVSAEGLKALEKGRPRKQVAQFLIDAAEKIGDAKNLLLGKRERLYSRPSDHDLIEFVGEAVKQDVRERELKKVITFFRSGTLEDSDETALYIKALLMGGKLPDAFTLVEKEKSVGWSYFSNTGVVFGAILSMLADHHGKATTIKTLFCGYANRESAYSGRMSIDDEPGTSFYEEIVKGLKQQKQTEAEKKKYFSWAEKIGKGRIDHIVSNKHRNAYERAAQVLGALAEAYMTRGQNDKAKKIIHHFYAEKYNRFSAFRREVKSVVTSSQLLRTAGFLN